MTMKELRDKRKYLLWGEDDYDADAGKFVITTQVRGTQYGGRPARIANMPVGSTVRIEKEPGNARNPQKLAVRNNSGESLGNLPWFCDAYLSPLMDAGLASIDSATVLQAELLPKRSGKAKTAVLVLELHLTISEITVTNEELIKHAQAECIAVMEAYDEEPDLVLFGDILSFVYGDESVNVCQIDFDDENDSRQSAVESLGFRFAPVLRGVDWHRPGLEYPLSETWRWPPAVENWPAAQKGVGNLVFSASIHIPKSKKSDSENEADKNEKACEKINALLLEYGTEVISNVSVTCDLVYGQVFLSLRWTCPYEDEKTRKTFDKNATAFLVQLADAGFAIEEAHFGHSEDSLNMYYKNKNKYEPCLRMYINFETDGKFTAKDYEWMKEALGKSSNEHIRNFAIEFTPNGDWNALRITFEKPCGLDEEQAVSFCEDCREMLRAFDAKYDFTYISGSFGVTTNYMMGARKRIFLGEQPSDLRCIALPRNMWTMPELRKRLRSNN
jgi:HIRAN domain.